MTTDEKIIATVNSGDVAGALEMLRHTIRSEIWRSRWSCEVHANTRLENNCCECDEAIATNAVINSLLSLPSLKLPTITTT